MYLLAALAGPDDHNRRTTQACDKTLTRLGDRSAARVTCAQRRTQLTHARGCTLSSCQLSLGTQAVSSTMLLSLRHALSLSDCHAKLHLKNQHSPDLLPTSLRFNATVFYVLKNLICSQRMKMCGYWEKVTRMHRDLCQEFQMESSPKVISVVSAAFIRKDLEHRDQ